MLLAIDFHKDFIDIECVTKATMLSLQSPGINGSEFYTPEADSFSTDDNATLGEQVFDISVAEIETVVEPDGIANDSWRESMTFISIHSPILAIWAI